MKDRQVSETEERSPYKTEERFEVREVEYSKLSRYMMIINAAVTIWIAALATIEVMFVLTGKLPHESRLIDSKVIIAFISAITLQVGTMAITGSKWFFRK